MPNNTIVIKEFHSPEERNSAIKKGQVAVFEAHGGLYLSTNREEDFRQLEECDLVNAPRFTTYFVRCKKEELPGLIEKAFGKNAHWVHD